jgi:hypothetical protein
MRSNHPPAIATWLLRHFGCSPNNDAVIGDLKERYRRGQTAMWYWKQVLVAIVVGSETQLLAKEELLMKRTAVWMFILVGVFSFGFWVGKMPMYQDIPKVNFEANWRNTRAAQPRWSTTEFLQMELDKAQKEGSQEQIADFKHKLEEAKRYEERSMPGR